MGNYFKISEISKNFIFLLLFHKYWKTFKTVNDEQARSDQIRSDLIKYHVLSLLYAVTETSFKTPTK